MNQKSNAAPSLRGKAKRERLLEEADRLFYEVGIGRVSLADVAESAGIPLGNVFYHFRSRELLVDAVIEKRKTDSRKILQACDEKSTPRLRLETWIRRFDEGRDARIRHGCRIGTLCQEANKLGGELAVHAAEMFREFNGWAEKQLKGLGLPSKKAKEESIHLLAGIQGAILVAQTLQEPAPLLDEIKRWIQRFAKWEEEFSSQPAGAPGTPKKTKNKGN